MKHTYEEGLEWIHGRLRLGMKPGLKRMEWMMDKLGHPERQIKTVHIGGTNGKGSTVTFLRSILQEAGLEVGTFTSPYIEQFNERISVNGQPIKDEEIAQLVDVIRPLAEELDTTDLGGPTEFEVITAMSLYYFAKVRKVDIVIYEVGLGGRFDSTNVITPLLSIITSIGLDHTAILGETHAEIAFEKAGIIKQGVPIISGVTQEEARKVIQEKADLEKAPYFELGKHFHLTNHSSRSNGEEFSMDIVGFEDSLDLKISMVGKHQTENASLAVIAVEILKQNYSFIIDTRAIQAGLIHAYWPGRFELLSIVPLIVVDGAHNEEGMLSLVNTINARYCDKEVHVVFAALEDKKLDEMILSLDSIASLITFVDFEYPRAAVKEFLFEKSNHAHKRMAGDWRVALTDAVSTLKTNQMLLVTGSLYFISKVKPVLIQLIGEYESKF